MDFLVQSVEKQPQCELMYGNTFCERSCDAYSLNRKLICFCPKAWEKDCSDYESDKLNTTDVELETTQPVRTLRVFPCREGCRRSLEKRSNSQRDLLLPDDKELQFTISNGTLLSGYAGMGAWHSLVTSQNLIPPGTQRILAPRQ